MNTLNLILQASGGGLFGGDMMTLVFMAGIFIVFWLFFIRPQTKKAKDQRNFIDNLAKGDKVITAGGIHGRVVKVDETSLLIEVDSSTKIRVEKSVISHEMTAALTDDKEKKRRS